MEYLSLKSPLFDQNGNFVADGQSTVNPEIENLPSSPAEYFAALRQNTNYYSQYGHENISFKDLLKEEGIKVKVTSEYRSGNSKSWHSKKDEHGNSMAIDIVPLDGDFDNLRNQIYSNPRVVNWLKTHRIGILEEITPDVMSKTGATGMHFHVGPDKWALRMSSMYIDYGDIKGSKSGKQRLKYVKNYLMENYGLDAIHASALAGVWYAESRLESSIKSKKDSGTGIAQWTGSRHKEFDKFYRQVYGKSSPGIRNTSLEEQINVAIAEYKARKNNWQDFLNRQDLQGATDSVLRGYENGGRRLASIADINRIYTRNGSGSYNKLMADRLNYAKQALQ